MTAKNFEKIITTMFSCLFFYLPNQINRRDTHSVYNGQLLPRTYLCGRNCCNWMPLTCTGVLWISVQMQSDVFEDSHRSSISAAWKWRSCENPFDSFISCLLFHKFDRISIHWCISDILGPTHQFVVMRCLTYNQRCIQTKSTWYYWFKITHRFACSLFLCIERLGFEIRHKICVLAENEHCQ